MRIISWNVNGLRSAIKKGFLNFVTEKRPDILCLQETKSAKASLVDLPGYFDYWNHAEKLGYSGTALFTKEKPVSVRYGMGKAKHDQEGRLITAEFPAFYLVNVYVPNSKRGLERLPYREKEWDVDFLGYLQSLHASKPVIFCGDMNVAHQEIDLANPRANIKNHGFTLEERRGFDKIMQAGFLDSFREFAKGGGHYTWWSPLNQCRKRNLGWRIDYICLSQELRARLKKAWILDDVQGSDHCPVAIELSKTIK